MGNTKKIFVTGGMAKAALTVVETLHRGGYEVHVGALEYTANTFFSRYCSRRHLYPSPSTNPAEFVDWLIRLCRQEGFAALVPVGEEETHQIVRRQDELAEHVPLAVPRLDAFRQGRDKALTMKAAIAAGVPIPPTFFPEDTGIEEISQRAPYPVLVKPRVSNGARGITLVKRPEQLAATLAQVESEFGPSYVQEYIPGGGTQYKVDMIVGGQGELLAEIVYHKLRYYPVGGGSSTLVQAVRQREILDHAKMTLNHMGWYGFADFDFIVDPRDNRARLIEINPRFPESLRITQAAGMDYAGMLVDLARGIPVQPMTDYPTDVYARFLPGDLLWFLASSDRLRAQPSFLKLLDPKTRYYVASLRDPGPFIGYLLENFRVATDWQRFKSRFLRGMGR